jgi:hypothetical protein
VHLGNLVMLLCLKLIMVNALPILIALSHNTILLRFRVSLPLNFWVTTSQLHWLGIAWTRPLQSTRKHPVEEWQARESNCFKGSWGWRAWQTAICKTRRNGGT